MQLTDNATWVKGKHTFQFGGTLRDISTFHLRNDKSNALSFPVTQVGATTGAVVIPAAQRPTSCSASVTTNCLPTAQAGTWNTLYSSLLGIVDNTSFLATRDGGLQPLPVGTPLINDVRLQHWEFYLQDTWRINSSLTLTYGLQYQWHTPPKEVLDRQTLLTYRNNGEPIDPFDYLRQKAEAAERGVIFNPDISYIPVKEAGRDVFETSRKGFSPRLAMSWQPSFEKGALGHLFGKRKTVFRGGYALTYDRLATISSVILPMLGVGFAQTLSVRAPQSAPGQPFRVGIDGPIAVPVNTAVTSPVVPSRPFGETLSVGVDPEIGDPYNHSIDFTYQRELPWNLALEVGYIGKFSRNLFQNVNLNSAPYFFKDQASGQRFAEAFDAVAAQLRAGTAAGSVTPQPWFDNQLPGVANGGTRFLAANQSASFINGNLNNLWNSFIDLLAPAPFNNTQVLDLTLRTSSGRSDYNAMFITLRRRLSQGLQFDLNYTLSKADDMIGDVQNGASQFSSSFDKNIDWGPSNFDRRHVANLNFVYDLPFGKDRRFKTGNWADKLIGGWYLSGIYQYGSGLPLTVVQSTQVFGAGSVFGTSTGAVVVNPSVNMTTGVFFGSTGSGGIGTSSPAGINLFANPEEVYRNFRRIKISSDTRSGRGVIRSLPLWNLNLSIGKETTIAERVKFSLVADFFNIDNHPQFNAPGLSIANQAGFGVITSAGGNRQIQLGARLQF